MVGYSLGRFGVVLASTNLENDRQFRSCSLGSVGSGNIAG